jgi:hypothetical protein
MLTPAIRTSILFVNLSRSQTLEPEPGDEPARIGPVRTRGVTDLAIVIA